MNNYIASWGRFAAIVFEPWSVVLEVALAALFYFSLPGAHPLTPLESTLLFIAMTIASVILGGRITHHWNEINEGKVVVARGRSAVRNLKLLLQLVTKLEEKTRVFLVRDHEIKNYPMVTKRNYEEIISACTSLQEQTVNSIENWTDIVPEADISSQIGVISALKNELDDKNQGLAELTEELGKMQGASEAELTRLRVKIEESSAQVKKLMREITEKKIGVGGLFSGLAGMTGHIQLTPDLRISNQGFTNAALLSSLHNPSIFGTIKQSDAVPAVPNSLTPTMVNEGSIFNTTPAPKSKK